MTIMQQAMLNSQEAGIRIHYGPTTNKHGKHLVWLLFEATVCPACEWWNVPDAEQCANPNCPTLRQIESKLNGDETTTPEEKRLTTA